MGKSINWRIGIAGFLSIALFIAIIWAIMYIISPGISYAVDMPEIILALIVIAGVVGIVASLSVASVVFNVLGLGDKKEAFALPRGSIRALIVLSLIAIFSIVSLKYPIFYIHLNL